MSGFGSGFLAGGVLSLIAASALSLVAPLPPQDVTDPGGSAQIDLETPAGSGFNTERPDTNPVLPDSDQHVVTTTLEQPEVDATGLDSPLADTSSAAKPDAPVAIGMTQPAIEGEELAFVAPDGDSAPNTPPAALGVPMPKIDNPVLPPPDPSSDAAESPFVAPSDNDTVPAPSETPTAPDTPSIAALPTIEPDPQPQSPLVQSQVDVQDGSALMRNRIGFDNPEGKPLLSIVLIDVGDAGLSRDVLLTFRFPISFAIDPSAPDAVGAARDLSAGGFELLALAPSGEAKLESAQNASDIKAAIDALLNNTPQVVGFLDATNAPIQQSRTLAEQVIAALGDTGHGFLTYDIGLNATDAMARKQGLRSATVFRVLDSEHERATVIKRYMDRAVLEAGKDGHVIMVGHTYPETVTALFSWALSSKSATVAIAPVSAVLLASE